MLEGSSGNASACVIVEALFSVTQAEESDIISLFLQVLRSMLFQVLLDPRLYLALGNLD